MGSIVEGNEGQKESLPAYSLTLTCVAKTSGQTAAEMLIVLGVWKENFYDISNAKSLTELGCRASSPFSRASPSHFAPFKMAHGTNKLCRLLLDEFARV